MHVWFYKCLQHVPLPHAGTRGPMASGPLTEHGWGIHSTKMQVGKEGALCTKTPKHGFPLRIHGKPCRIQSGLWEPGSRRQHERVCSQLKLRCTILAIRGIPAHRPALVMKCWRETTRFWGTKGRGPKRRLHSNTGTHTRTHARLLHLGEPSWTLLSTLRLTLENKYRRNI